jgi:GT2 family glycosyltransferase
LHWFLKLFILPLLDALQPQVIVEVGVEVGAVTGPLLEWARDSDALLHSIDPDPNLNVDGLIAEYGDRWRFHRLKSLEVLGSIEEVDLALIDGDHNWYTVINELRALEQRAVEDERDQPVILLHDIGWPYGRRDLYYDPPSIPQVHRQPHTRMGIVPRQSELGVGLNDHLENALLEGTAANGVLTAIEDFVAQSSIDWRLYSIPGLSGLAVLVSAKSLQEKPSLHGLLESIDSPEFLRAQCDAVELARHRAELKQAALSRRLAETQLRQVMKAVDPEELVAAMREARELKERVRELEAQGQVHLELEHQLQLAAGELQLSAAQRLRMQSELARVQAELEISQTACESLEQRFAALERENANAELDASAPLEGQLEREARQIFLDPYVSIAEQALPTRDERDPMALPSPADTRGLLRDAKTQQAPSVDVVVCVHDALEDLRACLWSLTNKTDRPFRLILVDDGSDTATKEFLSAVVDRCPSVTLIERPDPPHGYTLAANVGMRASRGDYVVLLNSDTIVSEGWLGRLVSYGERHERVGILGPLSNAASHQSVPELRHDGRWATNPLPDWLTVDGAALIVRRGAPRTETRLPFINGFCFAVKRAVIDAIGYLDEESFATGYCEENDYSQRARDAGFELAVVDDAYVYHAKSRSFGVEGREDLARHSYEVFLQKHGRDQIQTLVSSMEEDTSLAPVRAAVAEHLANPTTVAELLAPSGQRPLNVVFILPGMAYGGSGGSHSVYQEVKALRRLGVPARIALSRWDWERASSTYEDAEEIFETFTDNDDLAAKTADADVISATHYKSVAMLESIRASREDFLPAYYVQDYEPFFTAPYIAEEAIASYTALPDMLLFAKSHWLCNVVAERHGLFVAKVEPSIDEQLFLPAVSDQPGGPLRVAAMVRPRTARRQPYATVALLQRLLQRLPGQVEVVTFGCYADEIREIAPDAPDVLERHLGLLSREEVANLLRSSDVFLDMSVYQAFGRTALEAMACGCTAVLTGIGGVWEFVEPGKNALIVDTFDPTEALAALVSLAEDRAKLEHLKAGGSATAARYSTLRAAFSEYLCFDQAYRLRFGDSALTASAGIG